MDSNLTNFFKKDKALNLYVSESSSINYSDGDISENYIEQSIDKCRNISSLSPELNGCIRDWSSEYHFSRRRANLLRCLDDLNGKTVLEIGAGCGAITRYLGESGCHVIAIEGSFRRARICAKRCRDLDNVKVVTANFFDLQLQQKFKIITLIGVLEYSGKYINHPSPYQAVLDKARDYLTDDGILVIAIENKLGLKYFMGCSEDHTGVRFDGIQGYLSGVPVQTFGKVELQSLLKQSGFKSSLFLCPYPDYKIPSSVLRFDNINPNAFPFLYSWISDEAFRDYSTKNPNFFKHNFAAKELEKNRILEDLSNSFLVLASPNASAIDFFIDSRYCAWKFNSERRLNFATTVKLRVSEAGYPEAISRTLLQSQSSGSNLTYKNLTHYGNSEEEYYRGDTLLEILYREFCQSSGPSSRFWKLLQKWVDFLTEQALKHERSTFMLPGSYVDAIPQNFILKDGEIILVDVEWSYLEFLPLDYIIFRGIQNFYGKYSSTIIPTLDLNRPGIKNRFITFLEMCMIRLGRLKVGESYNQKNLSIYYALENELQLLSAPKN
ncbi:class I SAM-dependent methyltransferase [Phormidium yuhuli AB48]|uniref:Class I SAM-dependent methyltransferase n=1 Tax=Phormidium yuhuli AB48 TaxID=2940671 RepID=A0ABY5AM90_9CYAN|nr:class I SAM-dependent methyltransferase [Phormidium yuhuli]USR89935.1 class I SAM-dependent methyltransferase [Phormidium yuhuli AB48]